VTDIPGVKVENQKPPLHCAQTGGIYDNLRTICQTAWSEAGKVDPQLIIVIMGVSGC
jgi:hypothetical protein